jgi:hypothetical protein
MHPRGEFEFTGEGWVSAAPGADCIAMDSGGCSGFRGGHALGEQAEDMVLRGRKVRVWRVALSVLHGTGSCGGISRFQDIGGDGGGSYGVGVKAFGISVYLFLRWREGTWQALRFLPREGMKIVELPTM